MNEQPYWHTPKEDTPWCHIPAYVIEIWSELLPTHKERLYRWAEALEEQERNAELEAKNEYPKDDD
jgi:hypothetical protein